MSTGVSAAITVTLDRCGQRSQRRAAASTDCGGTRDSRALHSVYGNTFGLPRLLSRLPVGSSRCERMRSPSGKRRCSSFHEHASVTGSRIYRPRASTSLAWDSRRCTAQRREGPPHVVYKEGRKPMPDLCGRAFPALPPPDRQAFGYAQPRFRGWEADSLIANSSSSLAERGGDQTTGVSNDATPQLRLGLTWR